MTGVPPALLRILVVALCFHGLGEASAFAQVAPHAPKRRPPRESLSVKVGILNSWLVASNQGRPFMYLDFGLRYKAGDHYLDVKLPALVAGFDFLFYRLQSRLGVNQPFNLFEAANEPRHYGSFLEPANIKVGQRTPIGGESGALQLAAGLVGVFDFVYFDAALLQQEDPIEALDNPDANDPFVVGVGGFVSLGGDAPLTAWDLALGAALDLYTDRNYVRNNGLVVFADLDVQVDPLEQVGAYFRTRISLYTHTAPMVLTMTFSVGAALKLL